MERIKKLLDILDNKKRNVCFGAGVYGTQLLGFLREHGFDIDYYVVSKKDNNDEKIWGVPIININDITDKGQYNWIVSVSEKYIEEVKHILEDRNIESCFMINNKDIKDILTDALSVNRKLFNIVSKDKRCFIMGTGETLKSQKLKFLRNEDVFSCSFCSLMEEYNYINPQFYVLPALTNDPLRVNEEKGIYIKEKLDFYSKSITSPIVFCDYYDRNYIQYYESFKGKKIYYLYQTGEWDEKKKSIYDLCEQTPAIQTGSIMMLKTAMYMGYKKIYLIGTEHDLVTHRYGHAYDLKELKKWNFEKLMDIMLSQNEDIEQQSNRNILKMSLNMYNQYYYLHNIAKWNGIQIFNATNGGSLDEFERIKFETLF